VRGKTEGVIYLNALVPPLRELGGSVNPTSRNETAVTIEQSATKAGVKIGPVLLSWKQNLVGTLCGLLFTAWLLVEGKPWSSLLYLALTCVGVVLQFVLRTLGVDLTPEAAVIHGRRRRRVPWLQVQSVVNHVNTNGTSAVRLILENGEAVTLPFPKTLWRKGDAQYEHDFQRIEQWWLAHRGEHWHPVRAEAPRPPTQG